MAELALSRPGANAVLDAEQAHGTHLGRFDVALSAVVGGLALLLRLHDLGRDSLWLDEGYSLLFSRLPLYRLVVVGGVHEHPPFYYLLVHASSWVQDSYLVPRAIAAFAGAGSVVALYLLGTRMYGRLPGALASALLLLAPFHIWYSRDGRAYELAGLFVLLSYLALLDVPAVRNRMAQVLYVVFTVLALYTEYTTVLVLLPQALFILRQKERRAAMRYLRAWGTITLLFAPWIGVVVLDVNSIAKSYWIPAPSVSAFGTTVLEFLGLVTPCPSPPCVGSELVLPGVAGHEAVMGVLAATLVVLAIGWAAATGKVRSLVLLLWLSLPFALVLLLARQRSLYLDRVFLDATFPLYLLAGGAVVRLHHALFRTGALVFYLTLLGIGIFQLPALYTGSTTPDWKSAARDLEAAYRPGQLVIYYPGVVGSIVRAYVPPNWRPTAERSVWLQNYLDVPNWRAQLGTLPDSELRDHELAAAARGHRQVWLVSQGYTGLPLARRWFIAHGFHLALGETYRGGTRLELFDRGSAGHFGLTVLADLSDARNLGAKGEAVVTGRQIKLTGASSVTYAFRVHAAQAYTVDLQYQSTPPASPRTTVGIYDGKGHLLTMFPRTKWYDLPVMGVWLEQPFGFVTPPGSALAVLELRNGWGKSAWRRVAVYREAAHARV